MSTNEAQSKEWTGDGWRVIARPGQVMLMALNTDRRFGDPREWRGWMHCKLDLARETSETWRTCGVDHVHRQALEAAIAYAWPEIEL